MLAKGRGCRTPADTPGVGLALDSVEVRCLVYSAPDAVAHPHRWTAEAARSKFDAMTSGDVPPAAACTPVLRPQDFGIGILFSSIRDAVIVGDAATGRIVLWSPSAERLFGYTAEEALGRLIEILVPESLKPRHRAGLVAYAETGQGPIVDAEAPVEVPALHNDGQILTVELSLSPITTTRVSGRFVLAIVRDVTERKLAETARLASARVDAARAAEDRFRGLFNGAADAILVADAERRYLDANPAALRLLGYGLDELLTLRVEDVVADEPVWTEAEFARMMDEGDWRGELNVRHRDGTLIPVEARATVVPLPTGPVYLSTLRDVSERQEIDRLQGEFMAAVSHDLKNPLTTIRAQAQLLRRRAGRNVLPDPAQLVDDLDVILTSATRLASQLDELQDVARLRAGHALELAYEPTDLVALIREVTTAAQATTGRHGFRIEAPAAELVGHWDSIRLHRVLDNLLGNAIKYSPAGGRIVVTVRQERREDEDWAVLTVQDEGVGIPAVDLGHIFERFRRGSNVAGRFAGTGIGLSGARQIVEQHGGTIAAESEEGRGSTFTVSLPLMPPEPAEEP
jgi:PAS domain S-box-containing protein